MVEPIIIPSVGNVQRFAVAHIKHGSIMIVAPDESYCQRYASRQNAEFGWQAYHVIPYNEPVKNRRVVSSSFTSDNLRPEPKKIVQPITIKSKVQDYLKKTS